MSKNILHNMDGCYDHAVPQGSRRIAWDGVSFCVPGNWELAVFKSLRKGAMRIELEDEYSVRLESEWIRGRKRLKLDKIMKSYEKASKPLTVKADERTDITGLPKGWNATHFVFKETGATEEGDSIEVIQHDLVTAFYLCPESRIFCFFLLHFMPEDKESPGDIIRQIAATFEDHGQKELWPWELFDIAFKLPRELTLEKTSFDIGAKLMVFHWKLRRYFLWHMSCADVFLKDTSPAAWACGHMNASKLLKGPVFHPDGESGISWRRRRPYFLGHREEIASLCYKYDVGCRLIAEENKLVLWAYHYRKAADLELLPDHSS